MFAGSQEHNISKLISFNLILQIKVQVTYYTETLERSSSSEIQEKRDTVCDYIPKNKATQKYAKGHKNVIS